MTSSIKSWSSGVNRCFEIKAFSFQIFSRSKYCFVFTQAHTIQSDSSLLLKLINKMSLITLHTDCVLSKLLEHAWFSTYSLYCLRKLKFISIRNI